jgi:molecular chaperone DnaK
MKSKTAALSQVAMKLGQAIYEKEQAGPAGGASDDAGAAQGSEAGAGEEEVVDAEFSEVDDENKA